MRVNVMSFAGLCWPICRGTDSGPLHLSRNHMAPSMFLEDWTAKWPKGGVDSESTPSGLHSRSRNNMCRHVNRSKPHSLVDSHSHAAIAAPSKSPENLKWGQIGPSSNRLNIGARAVPEVLTLSQHPPARIRGHGAREILTCILGFRAHVQYY